jgi:DNA-binding SARP family transcriptional activator
MDFRVLGPLEVHDGERMLSLGGAKQRAVLAILLLRADQVVSSDRLIDELWGERPPRTAVGSLQAYISRLRKVLPGHTLLSEGHGYRLVAGEDQIDARRFEQLVNDARESRAGGDPRRASTLLRNALSLWRGPVLIDFAYEPFAQAEIARLEELRLAAEEERIDAALDLGRHAELIGELEALIAAHPLRERPRAQLMLGLYRSGRQADALEAYQDARRIMTEDLGIEPTPMLRELEAAILAQDPALEATPTPTAATASPEPEARKIVTVLFADVVASSALARQLDPERLKRVMGRFFAMASDVIASHGGTVEKFIGDEVMAVFGVPRVHEDDAARAVRAALELRAGLADLNEELQRDWGVGLSVRTGVNTGEVVTGDPSQGRLVTGHAVGVAEHLQQAAPPNEIIVGERTAAAARGAFEFTDAAVVQAKGSPEGLRSRRVVRALSDVPLRGASAVAAQGLTPVFVGRSAELSLLQSMYDRVVQGEVAQVVEVVGDPGVGKTTLLEAMRERMGDRGRWYVGRCQAYGRATTYRPLAEILRQYLGLRTIDPGDVVRDRLGRRSILALAFGLELDEELHPAEAQERLHEAWLELLEELAAERPAVVVIEDLHWADDVLLELLERIARHAGGPLLLVVTARPDLRERSSAWTGNVSRLRLEPLSRREADEMLTELAGPLPDQLRNFVLTQAEGNPFFVEEALASLLDRGVLRGRPGSWTVQEDPRELPVPDTVQSLIASRMDLLPPDDKRALQAASVVGRTFWEAAVRELLDSPEAEVSRLEERGFVRPRLESSLDDEREYVFKHALTREVAYASLPLAGRARLHAHLAEWLERTGRATEEHAPLLAHHYGEAVAPAVADLAWGDDAERASELRASAVRWLRRAAELLVGRYEIEDAVALLHEALALERDDHARTELWLALAQACRLRYDTDGFRTGMEQALALEPPEPVTAEIYAELAAAGSAPELWREPPGADLVERWTEEALARDPGARARALALIARARTSPSVALAATNEAVVLAEGIDDPTLTWRACEARADVAVAAGALDELRLWVDRSLAVGPAILDPHAREAQLLYAVIAYLRCGRITEARRLAAEHDAVAARLSPHQEVHAVAANLMVETIAGDWDAARELSTRAEAATAANSDTPCQFNWRSLLMAALVHAQLGDDQQSRRLEERGLATVEVSGPAERESALLRLALLRGDMDAVERIVGLDPGPDGRYDVDYFAARLDALATLDDRERTEREAEPWLGTGGYSEPFALRALGIVRRDRAALEQAATRFAALDLAWRAAEQLTRERLG